jgi:hypothetical protein
MFVVELLNDQGPYAGDQVFGPFPDRAAAEAWANADEAAGGSTFWSFYEVSQPEGAEGADWKFLVAVVAGRAFEMFGPFPDHATAHKWGHTHEYHLFKVSPPRRFNARGNRPASPQ